MKETLMGAKNNCLLPFFKNCILEDFGLELLKELDKGQSDFPQSCLVLEHLFILHANAFLV